MNIIKNGGAYLNIHTANHPDGEIRAQIRSSFYGFQCRGADRPEALNPLIDCGNGVREDELINYCCTARPIPPPPQGTGCVQSDGQCTGKMASWLPDRMSGWTCTNGAIPSAEDFKANESRADFYYFLCATPTQAPNPSVQYFCCYVPALVPPGGSCVPDLHVPGLRGESIRVLVLRPRHTRGRLPGGEVRRADAEHERRRLPGEDVLLRRQARRPVAVVRRRPGS